MSISTFSLSHIFILLCGCLNFCTDNKTQSIDNTDLVETLDVISDILENNEFNDIMWAGDINADFLRQTGHVPKVNEFLNELNLK